MTPVFTYPYTMPAKLFDKYGAICKEDAEVLEASLLEMLHGKGTRTVRVLEIGSYKGETGLGIKRFLSEALGCGIDYWAIEPCIMVDSEAAPVPFDGAKMIKGKSDECFHLVPDEFDLIFVDGNHSRNAVILDVFNYSPKVVSGGFMLFHDTSPTAQGQDYQYSGPKIPEFHIAVLEAFKMIGWPWSPWKLFTESAPADDTRYGTMSFRNG